MRSSKTSCVRWVLTWTMIAGQASLVGSCGNGGKSTSDVSTGGVGTEASTTTGMATTTGVMTSGVPLTTSGDPDTGSASPTTTDASSSGADNSSSPSETGSTGAPSTCGNALLEGDEACDDGENDGSYGGCAPGCNALGPHCGDGEINGIEVCDDGNFDEQDACTKFCMVPKNCEASLMTMNPECTFTFSCDDGTFVANCHAQSCDCLVDGVLQMSCPTVGACGLSPNPWDFAGALNFCCGWSLPPGP